MADVYKIGITIALNNEVSRALGVIQRDMMGLERQVGHTQQQFGRLHAAALGAGMALAGTAILGGVAKLVHEGGRLVDQQVQLQNLGISNAELAQATAAAWQNVGDVIGTNVSRNLELLREAKGALGTIGAAIAIAPDLERADIVRSFVAGHQDDRGLQMVMKAIEMRGDIKYDAAGHLDLASARGGLNAALKFLNASGGQIDAGTLKGLVTQAGPMAKMMQPDAFYRTMLTVTEELQQKAGTALSAAGRALYGGIMPQRNAVEMERLGLLDRHKVTVRRGGNVSVAQGALAGFDVLNGPGGLAEWVNTVLRPHMHTDFVRAHARTPGLTETQFNQQELYRLFPTETMRRLVGIFISQAESVAKGAENYDAAKGIDASKTVMDGSLTANVKAFDEAWSNLMQALGAPLVAEATSMVRQVTVSLNGLSQWAAAHPETVRGVEMVTTELGAFLALGGTMTVAAAALGPFTGTVRGLVGVLGGSELAAAGRTAVLLGEGGALLGLASGITALGVALIGLPPILKNVVAAVNDAAGIKPAQSGSAARGAGSGPRVHAGDAAHPHALALPDLPSFKPSGPSVLDDIRHWWNSPAAPGHQQTHGQPTLAPTHTSYVPPRVNRPVVIQNVMYLDGEPVYRSVKRYEDRDARSAAQHGMTGHDSSETPVLSGGMVTA